MSIPRFIRRFLAKFDVVLTRYSQSTPHLRTWLLRQREIRAVLDVGANVGQYAEQLREAGYQGRIISFEPLQEPFLALERRARHDPLWDCVNVALGDSEGSVPMHVAGNLQSSSFLPMLESHRQAAPESAYKDIETVRMTTLDAFAVGRDWNSGPLLLKLDVQGYESKVLAGARQVVPNASVIELELSLVELYEGQELLPEMVRRVEAMGFRPIWLERGYSDPRTGFLLQANGFFIRVV